MTKDWLRMARQIAVVYQDEPGRRVTRPKRQQAIGLATFRSQSTNVSGKSTRSATTAATKKPTRAKSKKTNVRFAPSATNQSSTSVSSKARTVPKQTSTQAAVSSNTPQRLLPAPHNLATTQSNQPEDRAQQQKREQALEQLSSNAIHHGPVLRKPAPARKLFGGSKTQAASRLKSSSSISITATAIDSSGFTSSTTLVATSHANSSFLYREPDESSISFADPTSIPELPQYDSRPSINPSPRLPQRVKDLLPAIGDSHPSSYGKDQSISLNKEVQRPSNQPTQFSYSKNDSFESNAICKRLSSVLTSIDGERFQGDPDESGKTQPRQMIWQAVRKLNRTHQTIETLLVHLLCMIQECLSSLTCPIYVVHRMTVNYLKLTTSRDTDLWQANEADLYRPRGGFTATHHGLFGNTHAVVPASKQPTKKAGFFGKVHLYANSKLPPNLPQFNV